MEFKLDFSDLEGDFEAESHKPSKERVKFPCTMCSGTGRYHGVRVHQQKSHCFACRGRGYFFTSPEQRAISKAKARVKKLQKQEEKKAAREQWKQDNKKLYDYLISVRDWNSFAQSMLQAIEQYGSLTEGQHSASEKMMYKHFAREEERAQNRVKAESAKPTIELSRINQLFQNALNSGLKKPVLRVGDLAISIAPATGKNAGCLYVKDRGNYAGKITPTGKFFGIREARVGIEAELLDLAADPMKQAVAYGKRTGSCSCCGRELTDPASVAAGIGPICAGRWGI